MIEVRYSAEFGKWLDRLRDANAYARIVQRRNEATRVTSVGWRWLARAANRLRTRLSGLFIYEGSAVVILLCGGDKGTQGRDIKRARDLAGR